MKTLIGVLVNGRSCDAVIESWLMANDGNNAKPDNDGMAMCHQEANNIIFYAYDDNGKHIRFDISPRSIELIYSKMQKLKEIQERDFIAD